MTESNGGLYDHIPVAKGVKSAWFKDEKTEDERRKKFQSLAANSAVFDELREMLQQMYDVSKQRARKAAGEPNWATIITSEQRYRDALEDVAKVLPAFTE